MKLGTIYIKRRRTDQVGWLTWRTVKEKNYNSVAQRKQLIITLAARYSVNNVNIVLSVIPRTNDGINNIKL